MLTSKVLIMKQKKTVEKKVADAVLQRDITISAGGREYVVPAPTLATLVLVSEKIADLPELDGGTLTTSVLGNARYGRLFAEVLAIYILGAKRLQEDEKRAHCGLLGAILRNSHKSEKDALTDEIATFHTPGDVNSLLTQLLNATDFQDFFDVSTFLRETSLTKPTKVEKTTASGQS